MQAGYVVCQEIWHECHAFAKSEQMFDTGEMGATPQLADISAIAPVVLAKELLIGVPEVFQCLLPGAGLQRGWTTRVSGSPPGRAFTWALLSDITRNGGWIAAVDVPGIALTAASEVGLSIERVLIVSSNDASSWTGAMGALIGSVDAIVFGTPRHRIQPSMQRRLTSRCRERGTVLMELADDQASSRAARDQPIDVDVSFAVSTDRWDGLGSGHGRLISREIQVAATGRRVPGRARHGTFLVPDVDGAVRVVPEPASPVVSIAR